MFFGSDDFPLYGVLHAAAESETALLICCPLGYEFMRSHRALKSIADQCSKAGIPALRFDYYGTGHSSGSLEEATTSRVLSDIALAARELQQMTGCQRLHVLGLRTGALLALKFALESGSVSAITLWDPVWSGEQFFDEMDAAESSLAREMDPYLSAASDASAKNSGRLGYQFSEQLEVELREMYCRELLEAINPKIEISIFLGGDSPLPTDMIDWKDTIVRIAAPNTWSEIDNFGSVLLPQDMVRAIVQHIKKNA